MINVNPDQVNRIHVPTDLYMYIKRTRLLKHIHVRTHQKHLHVDTNHLEPSIVHHM